MSEIDNKNESENLSRIRDILFGEDLDSIEKKLAEFKVANNNELKSISASFESKINELKKTLDSFAKDHKSEQANQLVSQENKNKEVQNKLDSISVEIKREKEEAQKTLQNALSDLNKKIGDLEKAFTTEMQRHSEATEQKYQRLEADMISKKTLSDILEVLLKKIKE